MNSAVHAVLIGAEEYGLGDDWRLDGPAKDVLRVSDWLLDVGVPSHQIHVLAAPLAENCEGFESALLTKGISWPNSPQPTHDNLKHFFGKGLATLVKETSDPNLPGLLLIYWSGHGAVENDWAAPNRMVFASDLHEDTFNALPLMKLADWLAAKFPNFRLCFLIDACAVYVDDMNLSDKIALIDFPSRRNNSLGRRFITFAAGEGQAATNLTTEKSGLFTKLFLEEVSRHHIDMIGMFDKLQDVIKIVRSRVFEASNGLQTPMAQWMEDEQGFVSAEKCMGQARSPQTQVVASAAYLCDRERQWREFRQATESHFGRRPRRPLVILAHGRRNETPFALFKKLIYKWSAIHKAHGALCNAIEEFPVAMELRSDLSQQELRQLFQEAISDSLRLDLKADADAAVRAIGFRQVGCVFSMHIWSKHLRKLPKEKLQPIFDYLRSFPDMGANAFVVVIIFVSYDPPRMPWLSNLTGYDPDRSVRQALSEPIWIDENSLTVCPLVPELSSVNREDLDQWVAEVRSHNRSWIPPSDEMLNSIAGSGTPMDLVVARLEALLGQRNEVPQ